MLQCCDCYELYPTVDLTERSCCLSYICNLCLPHSPQCRDCPGRTETVNLAQLNQEITRVHQIAQEQAKFYDTYGPGHPNRLADAKAIRLHLELLELLQTRLSNRLQSATGPPPTVQIPLANLTRSLDYYGGELVDSQGILSADTKQSRQFFESHQIHYRWDDSIPQSAATLKYLKVLSLAQSKISNLVRLAGLASTTLILFDNPVGDITVLATMLSLSVLDLSHTQVSDLTPLRGLKLTKLFLAHTAVADLSALAKQPLIRLDLSYTKVTDIAALAGMPLTILDLYKVQISDITVLAGMPLVELDLRQTNVTDYSVVTTITSLRNTEMAGYYRQ